MSVFDIIVNYYQPLLSGLLVTFELFILVSVIGILVGTIIGIFGAKYSNSMGILVKIFSFLIGGIPMLVILFWFYYPLQTLTNISIDPFFTAVAVLSLIDIAIISELVRSVLTDFPKQYVTVALMSGLSEKQIFQKIQLPMIFRQVLPSLLSSRVFILQSTLFASLISVQEIFRVAQNINAVIYKPIEIYTALAVFFILLLAPINYLAHILRNRLTRDFSDY